MARLSISQAAKEWGVSRHSIAAAIKSGQLTASAGPRNSKALDPTDLIRVFGEPPSSSRSAGQPMTDQVSEQLTQQLKSEVLFLRNQVENQNKQIEDLNKQLADIRRPILPRLLPWMKD